MSKDTSEGSKGTSEGFGCTSERPVLPCLSGERAVHVRGSGVFVALSRDQAEDGAAPAEAAGDCAGRA